MQEVALGKHLSPHLVHDGNLREKTVAADVKMVAFILHRSGNAAEDHIFSRTTDFAPTFDSW